MQSLRDLQRSFCAATPCEIRPFLFFASAIPVHHHGRA